MQITRVSPVTGLKNVRDVPCTEEQYLSYLDGELIQKAMPTVSAEDREFILSGCTPEDWNKLFPPEDE